MKLDYKKTNIKLKNKKCKIILFSDIHFNKHFNLKKFKLLEDSIDSDTNYIMIPGDFIDSTNIIRDKKINEFIKFIENISKKATTIISLGNHDYTLKRKFKFLEEYNNDFYDKISSIKNVFLLKNNEIYDDDIVHVKALDPGFKYYYNEKEKNIDTFISNIKKENLNKNKINIILSHTPVNITNNNVLNLIEDYDLILSGHMHNGLLIPFIDKMIKNNKGLIAPNKKLFCNNARGIIKIENKYLIISSGVTKIPSINFLDNIFLIGINEINIKNN